MEYVKSNYSSASSSIESFKSDVNVANQIESKLSDYIYSIISRSKLDGQSTLAIASNLETSRSELEQNIKSTTTFCDSSVSKNGLIESAFGNYSYVSDGYLTQIQNKINTIQYLINNAINQRNANPELKVYYNNLINKYSSFLKKLKELHGEVKECLENVKNEDNGVII